MTLHHIQKTMKALQTLHSLFLDGGKIAIADLDCDNAEFHEPGVAMHDGFDGKTLSEMSARAAFRAIGFEDAVTVTKQSSLTRNPRVFLSF